MSSGQRPAVRRHRAAQHVKPFCTLNRRGIFQRTATIKFIVWALLLQATASATSKEKSVEPERRAPFRAKRCPLCFRKQAAAEAEAALVGVRFYT